ncbi:MAG: hypothetical protein Q7S98_00580, partial [Deltaproteobacteria bacterium]|nr:hypothetical protein [Deltaproteobacteria bacterium]
AYDRTLLGTGTRVSASVSVFRQKQNVPDGETYFYNRPVKTIRPDHRWVSPEEMGPMSWSARQWRRAVSGPVKNFRDSVSDYYDLFDFVRQTPEVYLGLVGHPQGTPLMRFRHRMADRLQARGQSSLAGRVGGVTYRERPATRTPVAMDNVPWWNNQWRPFGGRPPFEAGDTRRLPTAQFHRRFWGREYW